ncbi:MAG: hypothetical protein HYZ13_09270 [Acidobacteria bacterium]|nr:hypothetical protein [Acidobacteriota bacterium]
MENENPSIPSKSTFGFPLELKEWKDVAEVIGLGLLSPGMLVIWGYAYFVLGFTPRGVNEWFPVLYASFNVVATLAVCLAMTVGVGGLLATLAHGGFLPSRNQRGVVGFRLNGFAAHLVFWDMIALLTILLVALFVVESPTTPWHRKALILLPNLLFAYGVFRLWRWNLSLQENQQRGRVWNGAMPYLAKGLSFFLLTILFSPIDHGLPQHFVLRALVMSGVRSEWTGLRIAGSHLELLKRSGFDSADFAVVREDEARTFLYFDQGRVLFHGLGTEARLELRTKDGKTLPYSLPAEDVREIGQAGGASARK